MLAHEGCAHVPAVHIPLQQSAELWHALPDDMQVGAAQVPAVHVALQQSLDSAQAWPALRQISWAQTPAEQDSLQQSVYALHAEPPCLHLPGGTGFLVPASPPPLEPPEPPELLPAPSPAPSTVPPSVWKDCALEFDAQPCAMETSSGKPTRSVTNATPRFIRSCSLMGRLLLRGRGNCTATGNTHAAWSNVGDHVQSGTCPSERQ
jgi:hypothetical protein